MHLLQINNLGKKFIKEPAEKKKTAKILPNKMQPYIRNKEINVPLRRRCIKDYFTIRSFS